MADQNNATSFHGLRSILLDVDGVLVDNDERIDEHVGPALKLLSQRGITSYMVTARPYALCTNLLGLFPKGSLHVFSSGAILASECSLSTLVPLTPSRLLENILSRVDNYGLPCSVSAGRKLYLNRAYREKIRNRFPELLFHPLSNFEDNEFDALCVYSTVPTFTEHIFQSLQSLAQVTFVKRGDTHTKVLVYPKKASKLEASKALIEKGLISDLETTCFITDSNEDLELLRAVGIRGALDNASVDVKRCANIISTRSFGLGAFDLLTELAKGMK